MPEIPADLQLILDRVAEGAARSCGADDATVWFEEGDAFRRLAYFGHISFADIQTDSPLLGNRREAVMGRPTVHVPDVLEAPLVEGLPSQIRVHQEEASIRTILIAPMLEGDHVIGLLHLRRTEVRPFTDEQIAQLETYAALAATAIENARLKAEADERNQALTEALEHQTATSEVLKVISRSPSDLQRVLDHIIETAVRLCGADRGNIHRAQGGLYPVAASFNPVDAAQSYYQEHPLTVDRGTVTGRAILDRQTIHVLDTMIDPERSAPAGLARTILGVPLLHGDEVLGVLILMKDHVDAFSESQTALVETFADHAVIAIENARVLGDLREALEHQTATAEVLSIISKSPTDVQPVLDAICESAARVIDADTVTLSQVDGDGLRVVANRGQTPFPVGAQIPLLSTTSSVSVAATLENRTVHIPDASAATDPRFTDIAARMMNMGIHSVVATPMRRNLATLGVVTAAREQPAPFSEAQIKLLETFADQAVIAIENVRLFHELQEKTREQAETLEEQAATNYILEIISQSPTNVQPVLEAIAQIAARVSDSIEVAVWRVDGNVLRVEAHHGPRGVPLGTERDIHTGIWSGQAVREGRSVQIPDGMAFPPGHPSRAIAEAVGVRTVLTTPMLHDGSAIGTIAVARDRVQPYTDRQVALLETFAAQAVIAIENVRLFHELEERNAALREALEHQTASAEVLSIISKSPTNVQPVLEAICESVAHLCQSNSVALLLTDGERVWPAATWGSQLDPSEISQSLTAQEPQGDRVAGFRPLGRQATVDTAILERRVIRVDDFQDPSTQAKFPDSVLPAHLVGGRSGITVPLLGPQRTFGAIFVGRSEVRPFADSEAALLQTFADQAVIAIENVRLLDELQQKTREQAETLEEQAATNHILEIISQSPTDVQPVLDAIVEAAAEICGVDDVALRLFDADDLILRAHVGPIDNLVTVNRLEPQVRWVQEHGTLHLPDIEASTEFPDARRGWLARGLRSALFCPLRVRGEVIGHLSLRRTELQAFSDRQIELIETFADQAVIAIENVRLFHELEERNEALREALEHQTATAEVLSVISKSPTDVQPVLDAICESAARVLHADRVALWRLEAGTLRLDALIGAAPFVVGQRLLLTGELTSFAAATVLDDTTINIPDVSTNQEQRFAIVAKQARQAGARSLVSTPMRRLGLAVGAIVTTRDRPMPFNDAEVRLLETFADQAAIAIENVRLFEELQQRNADLTQSLAQQTATAEVLEVMSAAPEQLQLVLDAVAGRAVQVCNANDATIYIERAGVLCHAARWGEGAAAVNEIPVDTSRMSGHAFAEQRIVHVPDALDQNQYAAVRQAAEQGGARAYLAVPLVHEGRSQGVVVARRLRPDAFTDRQIELLKTFADQAAIAIAISGLIEEIRETNEQLEIASQHKSQFLANMSHELRTPLNAILGYTELIRLGKFGEIPDRLSSVLERVETNGRHLLGLINDVLDLSKMEAGQLTLTLEEYALDDLVQTVTTQLEALAREKALALETSVPTKLPVARGDGRRITQVLLNLVGNAIKFTDEGSVTITAKVLDDSFVISVRDTGPGIAEADREQIFEEFQQAQTATTRTKGGTGLGLSIARRIVEMHGGQIWVESEPGNGSTFVFSLPVRVQKQAAVA
jgi:GAF domain-containing protein/anti-sigma regulatory factor (Ser/Thr protein kinase)